MSIAIHGNKNDTHRTGFVTEVTPSREPKVCPVQTIKCYLRRTGHARQPDGPVLNFFNKPYNALSSQMITNILNESICLVDLPRSLHSAKCFRPTGATKAVVEGFDRKKVKKRR